MKISINQIRFTNEHFRSAGNPAPDGVPALLARIGSQLGAVEEAIDGGAPYGGALIVKVVQCVPHANSDHLHVCKIDDGGAAAHVERDENGLVQVVCGASNVRAGITVAWLPPGATVPESFYKEPLVLEARELRGKMSSGMLASPRELALGDNHDGILEISDDIAPGTPFADAFNLRGDTIIDIENKMFTHRPDCFGWLGVARELAGIQQQPFVSPEWYTQNPAIPVPETDVLPLEVRNELPDLVPRFAAIALRGVRIAPSPVQVQTYLARVGGFTFIFKICTYAGIVLAIPIIMYHLYRYLEPLMGARKRSVVFYISFSTFCAAAGIVFAYFVTLPGAMHFLTGFSVGHIQAMLTVDSYLSFVMTYLLGAALLFQIPLVMLIINTIRPIPPSKMMRAQRYVIVAALVVGAVFSPTPDMLNQFFFALPIVVMYEVGVLAVWLQQRMSRQKSATSVQPAPNSRVAPPVRSASKDIPDDVIAALRTMQSPQAVRSTVARSAPAKVSAAPVAAHPMRAVRRSAVVMDVAQPVRLAKQVAPRDVIHARHSPKPADRHIAVPKRTVDGFISYAARA